MLEDDTSGSLYESSELSVNKTLAILFTWFQALVRWTFESSS